MPAFLGKLLWRFRRNRLVRLHTVSPGGQSAETSFEGWLVGRWEGHYVLERPKVLNDTEAGLSAPAGTRYEIPVGLVWWREVLAKDARL